MNMCAAKHVYNKYGEAREIETSRRFRGECNGCENECQCVAPSLREKPYPPLGLCVPQAIIEETPLFHIHDQNNQRTFY